MSLDKDLKMVRRNLYWGDAAGHAALSNLEEYINTLRAELRKQRKVIAVARATAVEHCCWQGLSDACKYHSALAKALGELSETK